MQGRLRNDLSRMSLRAEVLVFIGLGLHLGFFP
jgi:hypothetical protein